MIKTLNKFKLINDETTKKLMWTIKKNIFMTKEFNNNFLVKKVMIIN